MLKSTNDIINALQEVHDLNAKIEARMRELNEKNLRDSLFDAVHQMSPRRAEGIVEAYKKAGESIIEGIDEIARNVAAMSSATTDAKFAGRSGRSSFADLRFRS